MGKVNLVAKWSDYGPLLQSVLRIVAAFMFILPRDDEAFCIPNRNASGRRHCPAAVPGRYWRHPRDVRGRAATHRPVHSPGCIYSIWRNGGGVFPVSRAAELLAHREQWRERRALLFRLALFLRCRRRAVELGCETGGSNMRTMLIIFAGFVLWGIGLGIARLLSNFSASSTTAATISFVVLWFIISALNMWIGISQAGYSFQEELPIFLLIFLLPAATAVLVKWKLL